MRDPLKDILEDSKIQDASATSDFWILASALHRFYQNTQSLPVSGKVPDMTSTTEFYITLQNIYLKKAADDLTLFTDLVYQVMTERGV